VSALVEVLRDRAKPFLAGGVPDLQLDFLAVDLDLLEAVVDP